ncbi:receptor like protein 21-like [Glycine soja]|nr:receptor like protein 21-like [Glycine soja]
MNRKMKSSVVGVCWLILVLLEAMWCEGCWKEERDALLVLNSGFSLEGPDCCQWEGVKCNSSTGRLTQLILRTDIACLPEPYINYSHFVVFKDLNNLDLSWNAISGCVGNQARLENLQVLDMSYNYLDAAGILSCLDGLSSLKSLSLRGNRLNTSSFHVFETLSSKLRNLEVLNISNNYLTNDILPSLGGFTSLKELNLAGIQLDSDLHIQGLCSLLRNLEVLDLSNNNYNHIDIGYALSRLSSLKSLNLGYNQLTSRSIFNISKLSSLEILDLSYNNFNHINIGSALSGLSSLKSLNLGYNQLTSRSIFNISKLSSLEILDLFYNNFNDTDIGFALSGLSSLKSLNLGYNQLTSSSIFRLSGLISLEILDLRFNNISDFAVHQGSKGLGRLDALYLDGNMIDGSKLRNSLRAFSSVRMLSMSENEFKGTIVAGDFHDLSNLEHLTMDYSNNLKNEFFKSIGELTSLKVLSLRYCNINDTLPPADWSKLKKIEELDLSGNEFEGPLPSSFVNMTSLRELEISHNHFIGNFDSNIASLTSLEYFGFTENQFEVPVSFSTFANHSKIKLIDGGGNRFILDSQHSLPTWIPKFQLQELSVSSTTETKSLPLPNFLLYQNSLISLDFSSWKLEGDFPYWLLENNTKMTEALFRNCSFTGTFQLPMRSLPNLSKIDVSDNIIVGQIPSNNISSIYPNLQFLNLSRNNIQGSIPRELGQMNSLDSLDLSDNHLSREIPKDIFGVGHRLNFLKLSNNKLEGPILNIPNGLETLLLNDNRLTGRLPSNIFNASIISLDVSNNHLMGKIPSLVKNFSGLRQLFLFNNHFEGSIPLELAKLEDLNYLDLSKNNLTGSVPSFVNPSLRFIHLSNNHLRGLPKRMFNGTSSLVTLDLSYNEITNSVQDIIQELKYTRLNILLLKGNHFIGDIPKQLCQLIHLSILDLSHNNFSGAIPNCLGKMSFENKDPERFLERLSGWGSTGQNKIFPSQLPNVEEKVNFTSKKRTDTYTRSILAYMSGIDLSHNKLNGNIPFDLGNLTRIRALNLSHNDLIGQIPATFSNLVQTESLDLSFNKLSGQIPPQLSKLTSLEVFSVAHNNLSGTTPEWKGQFSTFENSSYEGNPFLCGPPLSKSCNPPPSIIPNDSHTHVDDGSLVDMYVFYVSFAVSFSAALLATAIALYINPYCRRAWFYYMELVCSNCYYFIVDSFSRFSNFRNM